MDEALLETLRMSGIACRAGFRSGRLENSADVPSSRLVVFAPGAADAVNCWTRPDYLRHRPASVRSGYPGRAVFSG